MPCKKSGTGSETLGGACSVYKHDNRLLKLAFWAANMKTLAFSFAAIPHTQHIFWHLLRACNVM